MKTRYTAGFVFDFDSVYLIEKQRPEWQRGLWNAIGGHVEEGETPVQTQRREFREETGVDIPEEDWELVCVIDGSNFEVTFFRVFLKEKIDVKTMTDERVELHHIPTLHDTNKTIPNLKWLIPMAYTEMAGWGMPYHITAND